MQIMTYDEWIRSTNEAGRHIPKGQAILRFEGGEVAVWREDSLSWSVTGSALAWGDPGEMLRRFGHYDVV